MVTGSWAFTSAFAGSIPVRITQGPVEQRSARLPVTQEVAGSNPVGIAAPPRWAGAGRADHPEGNNSIDRRSPRTDGEERTSRVRDGGTPGPCRQGGSVVRVHPRVLVREGEAPAVGHRLRNPGAPGTAQAFDSSSFRATATRRARSRCPRPRRATRCRHQPDRDARIPGRPIPQSPASSQWRNGDSGAPHRRRGAAPRGQAKVHLHSRRPSYAPASYARLAQLAEAPDLGSGGSGFDSPVGHTSRTATGRPATGRRQCDGLSGLPRWPAR